MTYDSAIHAAQLIAGELLSDCDRTIEPVQEGRAAASSATGPGKHASSSAGTARRSPGCRSAASTVTLTWK